MQFDEGGGGSELEGEGMGVARLNLCISIIEKNSQIEQENIFNNFGHRKQFKIYGKGVGSQYQMKILIEVCKNKIF